MIAKIDVEGFEWEILAQTGPAALAHSSVVMTVGPKPPSTVITTCGTDLVTACDIPADGSAGPAVFHVVAHDQYGNVEPNAKVWFEWGANETGNTITAKTEELDYCSGIGATCAEAATIVTCDPRLRDAAGSQGLFVSPSNG